VLSNQNGRAESWDVAKKIVELGRTGLDVLNLSMVCYSEDDQPPLTLAAAIDRLDPEILVVAAAGNHGCERPDEEPRSEKDRRRPAWPAALDDVIAVGAAKQDGTAAPFTPGMAPWIDVLATGVDVESTYLRGLVKFDLTGKNHETRLFEGSARWSGSSFAAALVSGAIAARTVPGRTPARAAWEALLHEFPDHRGQEADGRQTPRSLPLLDAAAGRRAAGARKK
jgi:membrane-anchored mycosin MYCP